MTPIRPRPRWYVLSGGVLLGSVGVGCLLFWLVVRPIVEDGAGSPLRIVGAFVVFGAVVVVGFVAAFVSAMVVAVRRSRAKRAVAASAESTSGSTSPE